MTDQAARHVLSISNWPLSVLLNEVAVLDSVP